MPLAHAKNESAVSSRPNLGANGLTNIGTVLNTLVADLFTLYLKTKNVGWHVSSSHFRDYGLLLDEQAQQIYATTDSIGARIQELGATTFRDYYLLLDEQATQIEARSSAVAEYAKELDAMTSARLGHPSRPRRGPGNHPDHSLREMLADLREDNVQLAASLRQIYRVCEQYAEVGTASLIETWTDQAQRRISFLEVIRDAKVSRMRLTGLPSGPR